jgi:hypothetical protein
MSRTGPLLDDPSAIHHRDAIRRFPAITPKSCVISSSDRSNSTLHLAQQVEDPAPVPSRQRVVGSSAMTSGGRQAIAIAIITRCRMPPDS